MVDTGNNNLPEMTDFVVKTEKYTKKRQGIIIPEREKIILKNRQITTFITTQQYGKIISGSSTGTGY